MRVDEATPNVANLTPDVAVPTLTLDVDEAAHVLRSGRSTVYKLITSGELVSIKIGRRRLVTYASCKALVDRLAGQ